MLMDGLDWDDDAILHYGNAIWNHLKIKSFFENYLGTGSAPMQYCIGADGFKAEYLSLKKDQ